MTKKMNDIFDIGILGHITKEIIRVKDVERENPGGTAYYTSIPLHYLGWSVQSLLRSLKKINHFFSNRLNKI